jgi:hypothetical protein
VSGLRFCLRSPCSRALQGRLVAEWVLIFFVFAHSGSVAAFTAEFYTEESCLKAQEEVSVFAEKAVSRTRAICVKK